jgi:hypothetical protein
MKNLDKHEYIFSVLDFERAFDFAVQMYLSKGPHTGRTSGEPRGLGAVLDAFTRGKLIEIAAVNILEKKRTNKKLILDFDMRKISDVADQPDIINVIQRHKEREPNLFIEIKNTSIDDRWIGLTEEQMNTMLKGSKNRKIFIIYASLHSKPTDANPSSSDFVGMYLKHITKNKVFNKFASLNAKAKLEFILSTDDLMNYGQRFAKGENLYETNLFTAFSRLKKKKRRIIKRDYKNKRL